MSIIEHINESSGSTEKDSKEKTEIAMKELSIYLFFDPSQPWVLIPRGSYGGYFDFLPQHIRCGPCSAIALSSVIIILSTMAATGIEMYKEGGILVLFAESIQHKYVAWDRDWYLTLTGFGWMLFICWYICAYGPKGNAGFVTFTVWSWTAMTIRYGLCVVAPFVPSVRLAAEVLRFPVLLSSALVFFLWNCVLFPVILFFMRDPEKRSKFLNYMTNFRLTQLHVFNILYAWIIGAVVEPRRPLHMGDVASASLFLISYMFFYYFVLDRLGVHLYPIFSLRTGWSSVSFALLTAASYAGFHLWQRIISL